jgi:hypothetical protein
MGCLSQRDCAFLNGQGAPRTGWERQYMPDLQPVGREDNEIPAPTTAAAITSVGFAR